MKSWLIPVLIILGVVTVGTVYLSNNYLKNVSSPPTKVNLPQTTTIPSVQATLTLEPATTTINKGDKSTYTVKLVSENTKAVAVETHFTFDPQVIKILSLEPGTLLPEPQELLRVIDTNKGTLAYALGTLKPTLATTDIVFTIHFEALTSSSNLKPPLVFDQTQTTVALTPASTNTPYTADQITLLFKEQPLTIL